MGFGGPVDKPQPSTIRGRKKHAMPLSLIYTGIYQRFSNWIWYLEQELVVGKKSPISVCLSSNPKSSYAMVFDIKIWKQCYWISKRVINFSQLKRVRVRDTREERPGCVAIARNLPVESLLIRSSLIFYDFCSIIIVGRYKNKLPYFISFLPTKRREIIVRYINERAWSIVILTGVHVTFRRSDKTKNNLV